MINLDETAKVTEIELIYVNKLEDLERPKISSSKDAYKLFSETWDKGKIELQEQFKIMLLDHKNTVLGVSTLASGGINQCMVDLRLAFATALKGRATAMILAHNHPTGNKNFSEEDKKLTRKFVNAGGFLDISILDHILVTREGYTSMCDNGYLPTVSLSM